MTEKNSQNGIEVRIAELQAALTRLERTVLDKRDSAASDEGQTQRLKDLSLENAGLKVANETLVTEKEKLTERVGQLQQDYDNLQDAFKKLKQDYMSLQERNESAGQQLDLAISDLNAILDSDQQG